MNGDELRAKYTTAYKIIARERKMREYVFAQRPQELAKKLAEIDRLLEIVTELKDELKAHIGAGYEQPRLLDAPRKADYS